uniref:Uncharacterized protein n=1 Tax=Siphoviridae sp. ctCCX1 TaxID=2823567 RepID=A0A8S5LDB7_9CAUD|nr:MAG TPA: hypothetical protein [Siphoviridae sp. ctCCX1]
MFFKIISHTSLQPTTNNQSIVYKHITSSLPVVTTYMVVSGCK